MVLLSKNKALADSTSSARRYRVAASMKIAAAQGATSREKKVEAEQIRTQLEADLVKKETEVVSLQQLCSRTKQDCRRVCF